MKQGEGIPLDTPPADALNVAFGCHHRGLSRVFAIDHHSYKVCCDCAVTFHYSLEKMSRSGDAGHYCRL